MMFYTRRFLQSLHKIKEFSFLYLIFFLLFLGCDRTEEPDPFEWQPFGLKDNRVFELTKSGNYLYAAAGKDGIFRKDLREESSEWEYIGLAEPDVNFGVRTFYRNHESGTMFAGFFANNWDGPGLFRSTDDGESWEPFAEGIAEQYNGESAFLTKLAAPQSQPQLIFAATSFEIFKIKDGNTGWDILSESSEFGKGVYSISFNPDNHHEIWAGGRSGFESARLLKSLDGGNTWTDKTSSIAEFTEGLDEVNAITFHPNNADIMYACLFRKVIKTTDGGNNWHQLEFNELNQESSNIFDNVSINPRNPNELLASGNYLYQSLDAGTTWQIVSDTIRQGVGDFKVDWDNRVVYGYIISPERGMFRVGI